MSFFGSVMFEEEIFLAVGFAPDEEGEFAGMVVAPHGAFAVGDGLAFVDLVPAVGAMVDGVEEEALVFWVFGEIRRLEKIFCDGEACGFVFGRAEAE